MANQITSKSPLLNEDGLLTQKGYAKSHILDYNPENIKVTDSKLLNRLVLKEWDYYGITSKDFFFSATVSNIGYAGMIFIYFIDFKEKTIVEESIMTPFGKGCILPKTSENGDIEFNHKKGKVSLLRSNKGRRIKVDWPGFDKGKGLRADIDISQPDNIESIVMATPIGKKRFYYNEKINCMPAKGKIEYDDKNIVINEDDTLATLDWGRGVWEYSSFWNWASASGKMNDNDYIGLNFGMGFGDLSYATENSFFINVDFTVSLNRVQTVSTFPILLAKGAFCF